MKNKIRTPFFEIGTKNYIYGDKVLEMGRHFASLARKYDVDVIYIVPDTEIRTVSENTDSLLVFAPYMDAIRPGRGMGLVLPEAVKAAGAAGVLMNHCERPMTVNQIKNVIDRANELDLITFACVDSIAEARAVAELHPDIINPEPTDLIGSGNASDMTYVTRSIQTIKDIFPDILVEQAAGITTGRQVYDFICAGSDGAGAGSGIFLAEDPYAVADEMISSVRKAYDDLKTTGRKFRR